MMRLPHADLRAALDLVGRAAALRDVDAFREELADWLLRALDPVCTHLCYRAGDGRVRPLVSFPLTEEGYRLDDPASYAEHVGFLNSPETQPLTVATRDLPEPVLDRYATFQVTWRMLGIREGVCLALGPGPERPGLLIACFDHRRPRVIERARRLFAAIEPFVRWRIDHFAHLERIDVRLATLESVLGAAGPLFLVDAAGRVAFVSAEARSLFLALTGSSAPAPELLAPCGALRQSLGGTREELLEFATTRAVRVGDRPFVARYAVAPGRDAEIVVTLEDPAARRRQAVAERCAEFGLTEREIEIVALVGAGRLDKEIASRLGISLNTVRNHLKHVFERTSARNRTDLVRLLFVDS